MVRFHFIISLFWGLILLSACQNESHVIQNQAFIDSLFIKKGWQDKNSNIYYSGLRGNVKAVSLSIEGDGAYFPFDNVTFDVSGSISQLEYTDWGGEIVYPYQISIKENNKIIEVDGQSFFAQFDMINNKKKAVIDIQDQESGETKYTLDYDNEDNLVKITENNELWYNYETRDRRKETKVYDIEVKQKDVFGNWVSIFLSSTKGKIYVKRNISYYETPRLIETSSSKKVFCSMSKDNEGFFLQYYDCELESWKKLIPPEYDSDLYGYKDFHIIGNHLYLIFYQYQYQCPAILYTLLQIQVDKLLIEKLL